MRRLLRGYVSPFVLCILFLAACGTPQAGIEHTPTPDHAATVAAMATESARLATQQVAQSAAPTPTVSLGKLAYVQGGDIWVKALPDAEAQRLTTDGRNREPRWSPSGEWPACRKGDDQVWVMQADGSATYPLNEGAAIGNFRWAPRAERLAYITGTGALVAVNADGSDQQELVTQGSGEPYTGVVHMAWSPDGEWLAYERVDVSQRERPAERYAGLWRIRADGSGATELLDAGTPATYEPILAGWSSGGSHLLFWEDPQFSRSLLANGAPLLALPADGGAPVALAEDVLAYRYFVVPAPSGNDRLAVIVGGYRGGWTNKVLHILSASTGDDMALTSPKLAASSPAWSPDGLRLAYVAMPDEGDLGGGEDARVGMMQRRIWVVNADGSNVQQLTADPAYRDEYPLWSANGSHILFGRFDAEDRASLWLIPVAGGESQKVVDELTPLPGPASGWFGYYGHVEWDTLFDWWRGPGAQLVQPKATAVVPVLTSEALAPAASPTPTNGYTWSSTSPDGQWVAEGMMEGPFLVGDDEQYRTQLKLVSADGTVQWTIVDETSHYGLGYTVPMPFHWSRDERYLYFTNEPVPDGCALFVNGSDLHRVDLTDGRVTEILPGGAWWLSLSPDETMLAYSRWSGERLELILRELARGEERLTQLDAEYSQAGGIVWSPDGTALMLTLASSPCDPINWMQSVVRVDLGTILPTTLIRDDRRLFVTAEWSEAGQVLLRDKDGNSWWMDAVTGQVTMTGWPTPDCPHIPLGGFYDVWRNEQVWPRLGCATEAAIPINGTEAYLCCNLHSIWVQEKRLFVTLDGSNFRWAFVADGSGLPTEAVLVTPTWQPPTATPGPPPPTPAPTPTQMPPPTLLTATQTPSPSPIQPSITPPEGAPTPLPTVVLMTRLSWPLSEPCFRASGRHGWLANLAPWAERCRGLSATNETIFNRAMEQFEGGWLLWNGNVCFVLFADGTWTMF